MKYKESRCRRQGIERGKEHTEDKPPPQVPGVASDSPSVAAPSMILPDDICVREP